MTGWLTAHRRSVLFALAVAALGGVAAAARLPVSLFPKTSFPRVVVNVESGDRPADRMVAEVTRPLELALRSVPGVTRLRSTSSRGSADLSLNFKWGTDMTAALLQAESAVNRILPSLPSGTRYEARRMDPTVFPAFGLTLTSATRDLVALHDLATYRLVPLLTAVPGVAQVQVLGGRQAEIQVVIDPARLAAAGVGVAEVTQAVAAGNVVSAVGRLEDRYRLHLVVASNALADIRDVAGIVLKSGPRGAITVGDVADVRMEQAPAWTRVTAAGHDAVLLNILQDRDANAIDIVAEVQRRLHVHAAELPADVRLATYYDQTELTRAGASAVRDAISIGAVLAGVVVLLFLRRGRLTLIVALTLPAVLAITALLMSLLGMSFNIMTLGGMAAAVGLVVDDTVVMIEHLMHEVWERTEHGDVPHAVPAAAREMLQPLLGSSLATMVVFAPLAFLSGVTASFFQALALTMVAALAVSFFVALMAVPVLMEAWLPRQIRVAESSRFEALRQRYVHIALGSVRRPWLAGVVSLLLLVAGTACLVTLPSGFMPPMDEGGFVLDYRAAPGTSLTETDRLLRQVEALIQATPEVDNYSRRTGLQLGGGLTEADEGDFFVHLKPPPRRDIEEIIAALRAEIQAQVPGLDIEIIQLMEDLIGDLISVPQPIEVKLFGSDFAALSRAARAVATAIGSIPGVVEVRDGLRVAGDSLEVHVDPVRASLEGLDADVAAKQLEALVGGQLAGWVQQGQKLVGIRVWTPPGLRGRIESLNELQLRAPDGHLLPLSRIADVRLTPGQPQLTREDLEPMVAVTGRLEGRDLGSAMRDVQRAVRDSTLPPGVRVEYGGVYAEQQQSFRDLAGVFTAAVLLVTLLLLYLYERWAAVVAILVTVLLAAAAVFVGLRVTGTELNISALMGLTMIVGIVTEIAVFYFAEIDTTQAAEPRHLVEAGGRRLRPVLMTTLIGILALLPLALHPAGGAAMQTPLAIAIISGLLFALPLVLLLMPAVYAVLARRGAKPPQSRPVGPVPPNGFSSAPE